MKLAIKLSNDYINITELTAGAKIHIHKSIRGDMPEGAFANGIVINTNLVADALKELLKEHRIRTKRAVLCVSGMDIIHKEIRVPTSAGRHVRGLIKNELTRTDSLKNGYLFDYIPDNGKEEDGLTGYSVYLLPIELIRNYEQTLRRAGLILERVEPVNRSMEKLSILLKLDKDEKPTILVDIEPSGMDILMSGAGMKSVYKNIQSKEDAIEENIFIVSAIQNIVRDLDPAEKSLNNLADAISRLIQFQSQNSRGQRGEQILLYGGMADKEGFAEKVSQRTGIPARLCALPEDIFRFAQMPDAPSGLTFSTLGTVCGRLAGEKKQLSFIRLPDEAETMTVKDRLPLVTGLTCLIALSVSYAVLAMANNRQELDNAQLEQEIIKIDNSKEFIRGKGVREQLIKLTAYNENCAKCIDILERTARFSTESFRKVDALVTDGILILGHEYEGNTVSFQCSSASQDGPAEFAERVTVSGIFEKVSYTGFSAYKDMAGATWYSFRLDCSNYLTGGLQDDIEKE